MLVSQTALLMTFLINDLCVCVGACWREDDFDTGSVSGTEHRQTPSHHRRSLQSPGACAQNQDVKLGRELLSPSLSLVFSLTSVPRSVSPSASEGDGAGDPA